MPQPQSLPAQHQHHPKQANCQRPPAIITEPQPRSLQSLGQPSCSSSSARHQEWEQVADTEQEIQQNHEEQESSAHAPPNCSPSATQISEGRKISSKDIQLVQNLIERCLQLYMNQGEVIDTLLNQAKIERSFTSLVWQKLEEQNPDFFRAYYTRLKLKKQIMLFNSLLKQQADLMHSMRILPKSLPMETLKNVHEVPLDYPVEEGHTGGQSFQQDDCRIPHDSQNFNCLMGLLSETSPAIQQSSVLISSEESLTSPPKAPNGSTFPFAASMNQMEISDMNISHPAPLPLDTSFNAHDPNSQPPPQDTGRNNTREALGYLGQLPRNFSLSDLTAELDPDSDLGPFGSYTSPFLTPDAETFNFGNLF